MLANGLKHTNYVILCQLVVLRHLWNLCFPMCGVLPLTRLVARNTMFSLLMISESLHGFIYFILNLKCLNISMNFSSLWSGK
jgi:hypothetical protein